MRAVPEILAHEDGLFTALVLTSLSAADLCCRSARACHEPARLPARSTSLPRRGPAPPSRRWRPALRPCACACLPAHTDPSAGPPCACRSRPPRRSTTPSRPSAPVVRIWPAPRRAGPPRARACRASALHPLSTHPPSPLFHRLCGSSATRRCRAGVGCAGGVGMMVPASAAAAPAGRGRHAGGGCRAERAKC